MIILLANNNWLINNLGWIILMFIFLVTAIILFIVFGMIKKRMGGGSLFSNDSKLRETGKLVKAKILRCEDTGMNYRNNQSIHTMNYVRIYKIFLNLEYPEGKNTEATSRAFQPLPEGMEVDVYINPNNPEWAALPENLLNNTNKEMPDQQKSPEERLKIAKSLYENGHIDEGEYKKMREGILKTV